eukprot:scaffold2774_cov137-Isochrysis_galbana.AAC.5
MRWRCSSLARQHLVEVVGVNDCGLIVQPDRLTRLQAFGRQPTQGQVRPRVVRSHSGRLPKGVLSRIFVGDGQSGLAQVEPRARVFRAKRGRLEVCVGLRFAGRRGMMGQVG